MSQVMINVNFFEKKEKNILPYIVVGGFLTLLLLMGIYFFFARMYLKDAAADKEDWIEEHAEEVVLSKRMSQLEEQYDETMELQTKLKEEQYPMYQVTVDIAESVPDEADRLTSFQLLESNQLTLSLENTDALMAQEIVENIESLPYIEGVQLLYAESQNEKDAERRFEIIVDLDESLIFKEEAE